MSLLVTFSPKLVDAADSLQLAEARFVEASNRRLRAARSVLEASAGCERELSTLRLETDDAQRREQDFLVSARNFLIVWSAEKAIHERAEAKAQEAAAKARADAARAAAS